MTNHPPSLLWYCWLGHQTCKNCRLYNLYCVGADVKPCSISQSIQAYFHWRHILLPTWSCVYCTGLLEKCCISVVLVVAVYVFQVHGFWAASDSWLPDFFLAYATKCHFYFVQWYV